MGCGLSVATKTFDKKEIRAYVAKHTEKVSTTFSKSVFCIIYSSENLSQNVGNLTLTRIKSPILLGFSIDKISEEVLGPKLNQYFNFSKKIIIHLRKTDIIFPFHYHW